MPRRSFRLIMGLLLSTALAVTGLFGQDTAQQLARGNTEFAIDLYQRLRGRGGNLLFSPFSISTVGILAYRGAHAETARQLAAAFHLDLADGDLFPAFVKLQAGIDAAGHSKGIELSIANSLWPQKKYALLPDYLDFARSIPTTDVIPVDYAGDPDGARQSINSWVEQNTRSLIRDILDKPLSSKTRLFLVNAIFFKGSWKYRFPVPATADAPFFLDGGRTVIVQMMAQEGQLPCGGDTMVQALELPYAASGFSMFMFLPRQRDGLPTVEKALTVDSLGTWTRSLPMHNVQVFLPRFELLHSIDLVDPLKALGVHDAFDWPQADFSGMDGRPHWLYADKVVHKAFVHVDEEGTVAAAATAAGGCFPAGTVVLTEDGPRAIEKVEAGARVLSCDTAKGTWSYAPVRERQKVAFDGDLFDIRAGEVAIQATGNHPFLVRHGARLADRPRPRDLPVGDPAATACGRWVEARDLEVGDVLVDRQGAGATITARSKRHAAIDVYNLDADGFHTYAVGDRGILVHNKGGAESPSVVFRADHPFLFLIRENSTGSILFMSRVSDPHGAGG
jgi:serpin B